MKCRILRLLLVTTFLMLVGISFIHPVKASTPVVVHYFYDESCTHCQDARVFLDALAISEPRFELSTYDVKIAENTPLFNEVRRVFGKRHAMTPMIVIGGVMLVGYNEQTQVDIVSLYNRYCEGDYVDVVQMIIDGEYVDPSLIESIRFSPGDYVILPLIGAVPIDSLSLSVAAVVIGIVDGFNPCAMWILLFLITMLVGMKNRLRMWILGLTFLITSAIVYFFIMFSWLNIALYVTGITWIRILIAAFALVFGLGSIYRFLRKLKKHDEGCDVTNETQRHRIIDRVKKIVTTQYLLPAMIGIIILAVSVNILEVACSAALPLLFTQILAYNQLASFEYYLYILIYIFFFLLDDLVVFIIAVFTLRVTGISTKYHKYAQLAGGIIMCTIGFLLMFFPHIIMFA